MVTRLLAVDLVKNGIVPLAKLSRLAVPLSTLSLTPEFQPRAGSAIKGSCHGGYAMILED